MDLWSILCLTFTFNSLLLCQPRVDIKDWLSLQSQQLLIYNEQQGSNPFSPSWIRELEFRTETEDFLLDKQEYLLRFRPTMPGVRKAQSQLIDVTRQEWDINRLNFQSDINRYLLDELFRIRTIVNAHSLQRELKTILEDEKELISRLLPEGSYNVKDLMQIEADIIEIDMDIYKSELRLTAITKNNSIPAVDQLISIEKLADQMGDQIINSQRSMNDIQNAFDIAKVNAEIELERAEEKRIFDYIQLKYNGPHSDLLSEKIAIGIGIELPHSSDQKLRMEELRVEQLLIEQEMEQQKKLDSLELKDEINELQRMLEHWIFSQKNLNEERETTRKLSQNPLDVKYDSPEIILYQKKRLLKHQLNLVDLENKIYEQYLDLLEQTLILGEDSILPYILE